MLVSCIISLLSFPTFLAAASFCNTCGGFFKNFLYNCVCQGWEFLGSQNIILCVLKHKTIFIRKEVARNKVSLLKNGKNEPKWNIIINLIWIFLVQIITILVKILIHTVNNFWRSLFRCYSKICSVSGANEIKFHNLAKKMNTKDKKKLISSGWSVLKFENIVFNITEPRHYHLMTCHLAFVK